MVKGWKVPFVNYKLQYRDMGEEIIVELMEEK